MKTVKIHKGTKKALQDVRGTQLTQTPMAGHHHHLRLKFRFSSRRFLPTFSVSLLLLE